ncbi:glycosyltransferase family 4 protein [Micromonospora sp. NPDC003776]
MNVRVARSVAERLGGRYDIIVPCDGAPPAETVLGPVRVHRLPHTSRAGYVRAARRQLDRLVADREPPGIGSSGESLVLVSSDPLAAIAVEWSKARRALPHLFELHGEIVTPARGYGGPARRRLLAAVTRSVVRRASGVRVVGQRLKEQIGPIARGPVAVIGSRVDTTMFQPVADHRGPRLDAVMVGSLVPVKNHATVLHAWARVAGHFSDARLAIAGEGRSRPELESLISALGLHRNVELLGAVPYREIPLLLARARLFLHPSWSEGQPRAVLEGMACGMPVICSDIPAHRDIVSGGTGSLVPAGDADGWATAITHLLHQPTAAAVMGRRARARVLEHHEFEANMEQIARFVTRVANTGKEMSDAPANHV